MCVCVDFAVWGWGTDHCSFTMLRRRANTLPSELEVGGLEVESRRESQRTSCLLTLWLFFICACFLGSSRMIHIQRQLTERCLELLALPEGEPAFILDVGCVPREIVVLCCVVDGLASTWKRALLPFFLSSLSFVCAWGCFGANRCGSGLSGETITDHGYHWVGFDISSDMLGAYVLRVCVCEQRSESECVNECECE